MKTQHQLLPKKTDQKIDRKAKQVERTLANQQGQGHELEQLRAAAEEAVKFERAAKQLLDALDDTITAMRKGREGTRAILDRLELRLASPHG